MGLFQGTWPQFTSVSAVNCTLSLSTQPANINKVSVFGQVKMASTDGAHQPPNDLHAENMVPLGNLDVNSWWTALQDDSILASYDADCLQHIFSRLELLDAMRLAFTCRRLYYHFKESQKRTKALNLTMGKRKSSLELLAPTEDFFVGKSFSSIARQFTATFASLRSLTVSTTLHPDNFETLLNQLNALPLLTTLGLQVTQFGYNMTDINNYITRQMLDFFWPPLAQLQHPALRHLTLHLDAQSNDSYEIPPLQILRQLTSFTFVHTRPQLSVIHKVIEALRKENYGVHLIPGIGACIELTLFKNGEFHTVSIKPELLPFITFLDVTIGWSGIPLLKPDNYEPSLASLFCCLPQMRNLRKIKLRVNLKSLTGTDYPSFLTAISSLPLLEKFFMETNWAHFPSNPHPVWPSTALPVLPRVRHLSLALFSNDHINVVEKLHLMHCFPELQQLCCGFYHISECNCKNIKGPQFHICGQELVRGLLEFIPEKIVKKIEFMFNREFYFSSLENLMEESRRKEQLKVANRLLADRDRECFQLRAKNELLKKQLAQTELALRKAKTHAKKSERL